ncbi:Gfo/Idh/MocA family oxidoreductase [Pedobacter panaciterrae]|jgi:Predicted dehydrogenases and related proteins|uniref:Gfo/Idh/MocA family oxidoreductase n=1 Tax=Pedobacter panaciterrae TaxID=363849 RepID=A0ABU8NKB1_9SPHI|nr:Gfo/Idh/MocA family oxidoreductase [Pedobacter panaciterrae]NQX56313.1 Gfo/Idh/MocA family oxidoreductase [Pedobacter panaciterrae]
MKEIKWGIIGCGDVTEVKSGPAFNKVPNSSLVAVMRRDVAKARDYASRHNVPAWYDNAEKLINDPEVNAVYIATPPLQHEEYTLLSLAAGKPVYVEKPMTLNTESALRMKNAAINFNVKLCVAHYRREQPIFLKVKQLLSDKVIGDIRFVQLQMLQSPAHNLIASTDTNWRLDPSISGGGLFHDLAPHQLDLMIYYFGKVSSSSGISVNQSKEYSADDLVTGQILFENGVVFNGTWCFTVSEADKKDICEITGSTGKISFPVFGNKITLKKDGYEEEFIFEALQHVQQPMIERVTAYFLGKGDNPCSAEQAILSMELMDSFTKTGRLK